MAQPREVLRLDSFCRMLVVVIITVALLLRIWALDAAISPVADPDEQQVICSAMGLHSQSSPHALAGNAVATYVSSLSYAAWYGVGRIVGRFGSVLDFGAEFFHDPRPFFMVARLASVAAGMLSVYLAFLIGRRLLDRWFGLALCLLVAVHPAAVAHAHQAQSHAFALALVLFGSWAVLSQGRGIEAIVADLTMGFAVGLAAEVTPAYLLILPVFLAYRGWTGRRQHTGLTLLGLVGAAGAASGAARANRLRSTLRSHLRGLDDGYGSAAGCYVLLATLPPDADTRCRHGSHRRIAACLAGPLPEHRE